MERTINPSSGTEDFLPGPHLGPFSLAGALIQWHYTAAAPAAAAAADGDGDDADSDDDDDDDDDDDGGGGVS